HWAARGKLVADDAPLRTGLGVHSRRLGLDTDRRVELQGPKRRIRIVASHVPQRAGAEIPPAAPFEGQIVGVIGPRWSRAQPHLPIEVCWHRRSFLWPIYSLRPNRSIAPDMHRAHLAQRAGLDELNNPPRAVIGVALVAHLGHHVLA